MGFIKLLIARGANIDAVTSRGSTALIVAAEWGHPDVIQALITKGLQIYIYKSIALQTINSKQFRSELDYVSNFPVHPPV